MTDAPLILTLDAARFDDIAGFYAEINRLFMTGEDWQLGESLDALDDMLYGGCGTLAVHGRADLHWLGFEKSRRDLGPAATRAWLEAKLSNTAFNHDSIRAQIAALEAGTGQTYFDILLDIFASHPQIRLIPHG